MQQLKPFFEALRDGFFHVKEITNPDELKQLREEKTIVDDLGYWRFSPRNHQSIDIRCEPLGEDADGDEMFQIAIYENNILLTQKLKVWIKKNQS